MGVNVAHFVLETFRNPDDQVIDNGLYRAKGSDVLSSAMMEFDIDYGLRGLREANGEMRHVLNQFA